MAKETKSAKEQASLEWWQKLLKSYKNEDYKSMDRRRIASGNIIFFHYDAKYAGKLAFWDKQPLVILFNDVGNKFYGLNLHYIPRPFRPTVLKLLIQINRNRIKKDKRFQLSWTMIKEFVVRNSLKLAIRSYIKGRMSSVQYIKPEDWKYTADLPSHKFVFNGSMTEEDLMKLILSHGRSTKKAKNTRFGRKVKQ